MAITFGPVTNKNETVHAAWQGAIAKVRAAEERLGSAWSAYTAGRGPPPTKEMLEEVSRLRRDCDQLLTAVIDLFGAEPIRGDDGCSARH